MSDGIIERLRTLGMSLYEARSYLSLLQHGPQNGNELSKSAGLPSSKVYSTLEKLASQGIVHSVQTNHTRKYVCVSPEELMHRFRQQFEEPLQFLDRVLPTLSSFVPAAEILTVSGLDAIRENSGYIVDRARREIHLSIWAEDLDPLREPLHAAAGRGVQIFGMVYGDEPLEAGSWERHSYRDIVENRIGGRMLTLVADAEETLIAHIPRQGEATAVRTRNPVLTLIAEEYLHHDLVLQRAQVMIGFDQWDRWWQADPDLRTRILGQSLEDAARSEEKEASR